MADTKAETALRRILVVDDDADMRALTAAHLGAAHYEVVVAPDGAAGLEMALTHPPDAVLTDIVLPKLDGFRLIERLREHEQTASLPIVVITGLEEKTIRSRLQGLGVEDYVAKPFKREALLSAVSRSLRDAPTRTARSRTRGALSVTNLSLPAEPNIPADAQKQAHHAAVLSCRVARFTSFAAAFSGPELAEILSAYCGKICEPILAQEGWVINVTGESVLALFESASDRKPDHARRGLLAALQMAVVARDFRHWLAKEFAHKRPPQFAISIALHLGEVTVYTVPDQDPIARGVTIRETDRMLGRSKELAWTIAGSALFMRAVGPGFEVSGKASVVLPGESGGGSVEILAPSGFAEARTVATLQPEMWKLLQLALEENSLILAESLRSVLERTDEIFIDRARRKVIAIEGYRLIRKLGEGGMSEVFLAENIATRVLAALKVLDFDIHEDQDRLQRFIHEFALISQINHPNVARIYGQGFTDHHAYIAMEYFASGDLRKLIRSGAAATQALDLLEQIAQALLAIHSAGMVHRDLKPDNLMLREDGSLALADFGIAKHIDTDLMETSPGKISGTPYYLSPEQITGAPTDARSDIYSVGVIFYEMLTSEKPYRAASTSSLFDLHVKSPVPMLPAQHAKYQPLLEGLMAKDRDKRFKNAQTVWRAILELR